MSALGRLSFKGLGSFVLSMSAGGPLSFFGLWSFVLSRSSSLLNGACGGKGLRARAPSMSRPDPLPDFGPFVPASPYLTFCLSWAAAARLRSPGTAETFWSGITSS
eukprot:6482190-Amphidinium_carterae.1